MDTAVILLCNAPLVTYHLSHWWKPPVPRQQGTLPMHVRQHNSDTVAMLSHTLIKHQTQQTALQPFMLQHYILSHNPVNNSWAQAY